jgi:hypothetical protein
VVEEERGRSTDERPRASAPLHFFFASAAQVPAPHEAWAAPGFFGAAAGALVAGFLLVSAFAGVASAAFVSGAGVAAAGVVEAALVLAADGSLFVSPPVFAAHDACPAPCDADAPQWLSAAPAALASVDDAAPVEGVVGAAGATSFDCTGDCGAGDEPPQPARTAVVPRAASVLAMDWRDMFGRISKLLFRCTGITMPEWPSDRA